MASLKCPSCGFTNFADAPECKRCRIPLGASFNEAEYYYPAAQQSYAPRKTSWRWAVYATLTSIVLSVILFFGIFFYSFLSTATTGPMNPTVMSPQQLELVGRRFGIALIIELLVVWRYFFRRRDNYRI